jgi:NNMT/PNMT/TEMT family
MPVLDSFASFSAATYLDEYYSTIGPENDRLLRFLARVHRHQRPGGRMLEFGCGPTIYQLISPAARFESIDVCDYLDDNLTAIRSWKSGASSHDWTPFFDRALQCESKEAVDEAASRRRADLVRSRLERFLPCDALDDVRLLPGGRPPYDSVGVNFVLESITADRDAWAMALTRVAGLVATGGHLVLCSLEQATYWRCGPSRFPAVPLSRNDILDALRKLGFHLDVVEHVDAEVVDASAPDYAGYPGMLLVSATKIPLGS